MSTNLLELLSKVAAGQVDPAAAAAELQSGVGVADLGFARVDLDRERRRGVPEAIFCQGKTPEQICSILQRLIDADQVGVCTRLSAEHAQIVLQQFPNMAYDALGRVGVVNAPPPASEQQPLILVVAAGTSDLPVAREAALCAAAWGQRVDTIVDVGVAGLQRILAVKDRLAEAAVIIAVAGMEAALPTVLTGLVACPVIGVPTSVGYGTHLNGIAPLLSMLNSCAGGLAVMNIDNGFGAAHFATLVCRLAAKP